MSNKAMQIADFSYQCATDDEYLRVFIVEQNMVGISAVLLLVFYHCLWIHDMPQAIMCKHDVIQKTGST